MAIKIVKNDPVPVPTLLVDERRYTVGADEPIVIVDDHAPAREARPHPGENIPRRIVDIYVDVDVTKAETGVGDCLSALLGEDPSQEPHILEMQVPFKESSHVGFRRVGMLAATVSGIFLPCFHHPRECVTCIERILDTVCLGGSSDDRGGASPPDPYFQQRSGGFSEQLETSRVPAQLGLDHDSRCN